MGRSRVLCGDLCDLKKSRQYCLLLKSVTHPVTKVLQGCQGYRGRGGDRSEKVESTGPKGGLALTFIGNLRSLWLLVTYLSFS